MVAGLDQLSEADYTGALKTGLLMMLKGAMNHCSDEQCLQKLITANSSSLKDRMARMSDKAFENTYKTLDQALDTVQLHVVFPLHTALLRGMVTLNRPETLAKEIHIVVHLNINILVKRERKAQHIVTLNLLVVTAAVVRRQRRFQRTPLVI